MAGIDELRGAVYGYLVGRRVRGPAAVPLGAIIRDLAVLLEKELGEPVEEPGSRGFARACDVVERCIRSLATRELVGYGDAGGGLEAWAL